MSVCHYRRVPAPEAVGGEPVRYACQEKPCKDNNVILVASALDTHADRFHNADYVELNFEDYRKSVANSDIVLEEMQSPT